MLQNNKVFLASVASATAFAVGCANTPEVMSEGTPSKTAQAAAAVGATHYTIINFPEGQDNLTPAEKQKLRQLAVVAATHGNIAEVTVLAWADREYPAEGQYIAKDDARLADQRAEKIESYFKNDIQLSSDVETHNMAKRPGFFSQMLHSGDYKTKTTFENVGAAPSDIGPGQTLLGKKASKAIVLVKYE
ncbi:MAG: hypothetical protein ACKOX6_09765 [Bdellovibrio sp.]